MANKLFTWRNTRLAGSRYERLAAQFLQQQGLTLRHRNYLCKLGEIDLIMTDTSQYLVFVEIRFRAVATFGDAIATVTPSKQRKIKLAAAHFLTQNPQFSHYACRFDVVGVSPQADSRAMHYAWIRHAFM